MHTDPCSQYRQTDIRTASPPKLVALMFRAAIQAVRRARQALADSNEALFRTEVRKARGIIWTLWTSLNPAGGEIAVNLAALYQFLYNNLDRADWAGSLPDADGIIAILQDIASGWEEATLSTADPARSLGAGGEAGA